MPSRKSEEDVMIKFCKSWESVCEEISLVKILQSCYFNLFGTNHRCLRKMLLKKNIE